MGRQAIPVDKVKLQGAIESCEFKRQYTQRQNLFVDVAAAYALAMGLESVSPAWVYLRIEELGLEVKTPKGKKGRVAGSPAINGGSVRIPRGQKFAADSNAVAHFERLEKVVKQVQKGRFMPVFEKAKAGSVKALVKLNCLYCANWQTNEVKNCQCMDCPLLVIRPYQNSNNESEAEDEVEVEPQEG